MTDGVAICAVLQRPVRVHSRVQSAEEACHIKPKLPLPIAEFMKHGGWTPDQVHCIAEDPGRVVISQVAQLDESGQNVNSRLTRKSFLKRTLQNVREDAERDLRRQDRLLRVAIDHLGQGVEGRCRFDVDAFLIQL